jgi:hypothetical protein
MELTALMELQVPKVILVHKELLDPKVILVIKALLVHKE